MTCAPPVVDVATTAPQAQGRIAGDFEIAKEGEELPATLLQGVPPRAQAIPTTSTTFVGYRVEADAEFWLAMFANWLDGRHRTGFTTLPDGAPANRPHFPPGVATGLLARTAIEGTVAILAATPIGILARIDASSLGLTTGRLAIVGKRNLGRSENHQPQ